MQEGGQGGLHVAMYAPLRDRHHARMIRSCASVTVLTLLLLAGCHCQPPVSHVDPARLSLDPTTLAFPATFVGAVSRQTVHLLNSGGASASVDVHTSAPFSSPTTTLHLGSGDTVDVTVDFAPLVPGAVSGTLTAGELSVELLGEGLAPPDCSSTNPCETKAFDYSTSACLAHPHPDGEPCASGCLSTGQCQGGVCVGSAMDCGDANACTIDACGEGGCLHTPVICPAPASVCQVAACDALTGCGVESVVDGSLCGPDDCQATQVDVCLAGQCVTRPRPDTGRCANRWVLAGIPARLSHAMATDFARHRVVLFGGQGTGGALGDTWEWDGTIWSQRTPVSSPPARFNHAMAWDAARHRVVLFGGFNGTATPSSDTWEWDGTTWLERTPATSPPARAGHAMAWDGNRQRVVLFGGAGASTFSDTWEWDGTTWTQRTPATSPSTYGSAMAWDAVHQRVVLNGGAPSGSSSETWEWDGTTWTRRTPATPPPARAFSSLAWDPVRQRVVLMAASFSGFSDTWEWDGSAWLQRVLIAAPPGRGASCLAWDEVRQQVVLFGGTSSGPSADTWAWDGAVWVERAPVRSPPTHFSTAMAWDAAGQRIVLFGGNATGGFAVLGDTLAWDGTTWAPRSPATSPQPRRSHAMAGDLARQRVVLFGGEGNGGLLADTWEWDGATWLQRTPGSSPSARRSHAMAWDAARQRVVLFGGGTGWFNHLSDTWEWDGSTWLERTSATSPPARSEHALAWDAARQRVVLWGGTNGSTTFTDTWEWDGTDWTPRPGLTAPPLVSRALAWDSTRQRLILFGASSGGGSATWQWDPAAGPGLAGDWVDRKPVTSPPASTGQLAYDSARQRLVFFNGTDTWLYLP